MLPSKLRHPLEFHHQPKFVYSKIGWYQENRGISWTICLDPKMGWYQQNQVGFTQQNNQHKLNTKWVLPQSTYTRQQNLNVSIWSCSSNDISGYRTIVLVGFFASGWRLKSHAYVIGPWPEVRWRCLGSVPRVLWMFYMNMMRYYFVMTHKYIIHNALYII